MSSALPVGAPPQPHEPAPLAAFLSYLLPGLGQIYQGRYGKGILFMVSLLGMFSLGQAMGDWQNVYLPRSDVRNGGPSDLRYLPTSLLTRWHYIGQFWIGVYAWPALYHYFEGPLPDAEANPFIHNFQRAPDERKLNAFLVNSDKTPDLGWVYTVVAGMLNILVIYDAYAGPLVPARPAPKKPDVPAGEPAKEGVA